MDFLQQSFNIGIDVFLTLIFIRVAVGWLARDVSHHPLVHFLVDATEPLLSPIRRMIPTPGGLDFSPILAYFLLEILRSLGNALLT